MKKRRSLRFRLRPVKRDAQRHDDREHAQVGEYVPAVRHDGRRAKEDAARGRLPPVAVRIFSALKNTLLPMARPTASAIAVGRPYFFCRSFPMASPSAACVQRDFTHRRRENPREVCAGRKKCPSGSLRMGKILACGMRYSAHSTMQACSRVAVAYGWKLPSGMPLMTPARCSACTAGRA